VNLLILAKSRKAHALNLLALESEVEATLKACLGPLSMLTMTRCKIKSSAVESDLAHQYKSNAVERDLANHCNLPSLQ
jgi:hypothetical protein